ncbi:hypothetical protein F5X98DRAFT_381518 [Xylaria grammica]|nr:hypothetical protein F5X98DRAFT_381518 [Xylaria grammica]
MPEKDLFDWVPSKFPQPLDFQDPDMRQLDGYVSACNFRARQEARRQEHAQRCSTPIDVHDGICGLSNNDNDASTGTDRSAPVDAKAALKVPHGTRSDATGCSADSPSKYVMTVLRMLNTMLDESLAAYSQGGEERGQDHPNPRVGLGSATKEDSPAPSSPDSTVDICLNRSAPIVNVSLVGIGTSSSCRKKQRSEANLAKVAEAALQLQASLDSRDSLVPAEKQAVGGNDVSQKDMVLQEHTQPKQPITRALKLTMMLNGAGEHFSA